MPNTFAHPAEAALGIPGFTFADLHKQARLHALYDRFCADVAAMDPEFWREWDAYRQAPDAPRTPVALSNLLVRMAPHVSRFVARLFGVEADVEAMVAATRAEDPLFRFKIDFVRRRALPLLKSGAPVDVTDADRARVARLMASVPHQDPETALAAAGCALLDREAALGDKGRDADIRAVADQIESLKRWCAAHVHDPAYRTWVAFRFPENIDYLDLVQVIRPNAQLRNAMVGPEGRRRRRDGFTLTDPRASDREVLGEIHYCVLCHERDKDTCSKGIHDKAGHVAENPLGIPLKGCPLCEKISEMHAVRKRGDAIGALALITLDNPMVPGTGHRICNDCMKACIYQKQEPVDIPQAETGILTDVLRLPWGVEIYQLLSKWNPVNVRRPYPAPYNGRNVLVVGLGPAGYTLSHYLLNEGFGVVAIDGLKIEPMPDDLVGRQGKPPRPVREWGEIYRPLDQRVLEGFGGVSEYGITVRWDKNFLTLLHLTLERRERLKIYGGIRFGGTLPIEDAWNYGFHHVAIAAGAGRPTIIDIKNNLIRGIRKASDFLMALQLTGAFKRDALPNLQMRLPAVVIGGGLTGVDTATELLAYYPLQVEKVLERYEGLVEAMGEAEVRAIYDEEERQQLDEFVAHGRAVRAERARAAATGERPDFISLVRRWGGVSLVYRKRLVDAPAYRLNHEEVAKALEEGIGIVENLNPVEALADQYGHVRALVFEKQGGEAGTVELAARSVLVAAGTVPNTIYEKEHPGTFALDSRQKFFQGYRAVRQADGTFALEGDANGFFTSYDRDGRFVSYYGDNHPRYAGNVVKAMASAKDGYGEVVKLFAAEIAAEDPADQPARERVWTSLTSTLDRELLCTVEDVIRLTPTIVEVVVKAPAAARHFHPGQFYRLQNFASGAVIAGEMGHRTPLVMEGLALTGAWVDAERGLLSMVTLEMGASSRLVAYLARGEPVVVMGPTGAPTEIPHGESVLLAGGGLGNAVLFSIAKAMRKAGNKVIYFAAYKTGEDLFKREEIEAATDQVIWSTDGGEPIVPGRAQDAHVRGNIIQAMVAYAKGELGEIRVPLAEVSRLVVIGSDRMMAAVKAARHGLLKPYVRERCLGIGSINSPMQCMMKEVCAQCLQKHVDPVTGKEEFIFSCFNQDQDLEKVDFPNLRARLRQNSVQEKLADLWLAHLLTTVDAPRV